MEKNKYRKYLKINSVFYFVLIILIGLSAGFLIIAEKLAPNYFDNSPSIFELKKSREDISKVSKIKKPIAKTNNEIVINATSYLVIDRETLTPLVSYDPNTKLPLASITKLMTAIVVLENSNIEDIVEIKNDFSTLPDYKLGLYAGEKITIEDLLYAALIPSANDAAEALAYYIGKGNHNTFIKMMNDKALEIGMENTLFSNAIGIDDISNYSTVSDLAYLANYAINNEFIANAVTLKEKIITDASETISYSLKSTNQLLGDSEVQVLGLKTGTTPAAGECLLSVEKLKNGQEILTVLLGSSDRFGDTKKLVKWVEENVEWR